MPEIDFSGHRSHNSSDEVEAKATAGVLSRWPGQDVWQLTSKLHIWLLFKIVIVLDNLSSLNRSGLLASLLSFAVSPGLVTNIHPCLMSNCPSQGWIFVSVNPCGQALLQKMPPLLVNNSSYNRKKYIWLPCVLRSIDVYTYCLYSRDLFCTLQKTY